MPGQVWGPFGTSRPVVPRETGPAPSSRSSGCQRDGAVTAPTRSGGETSWWVAPALALLLEHRGMKGVTHPDACLEFCPLPTRELGGSSRTGPRGGERCRPGVRQCRRNRREANPAKYLEGGLGFQKRLGLCSNQS